MTRTTHRVVTPLFGSFLSDTGPVQYVVVDGSVIH
jgi:hypothetical protein